MANNEKELLWIKIGDILFRYDPFSQRDIILAFIITTISSMDVETIGLAKEILGLDKTIETQAQLVEALSYQRKNPRDLRKLAYQLLQLAFLPEKFKNFSSETHRKLMNHISQNIKETAREYCREFQLLQIGSMVREKINAFSDLDYILFLGESHEDAIDFFARLGSKTNQVEETLSKMNPGVKDRAKLKLTIRGIKISFLILDHSLIGKILEGKAIEIRGYKPEKASVHEIRTLAGERRTIINQHSQFTWRPHPSEKALTLIGKIIDNIVTAEAVSGEISPIIIERTMHILAKKMIEAYDPETPTFDNFLACLYRGKRADYSQKSLHNLELRWQKALSSVSKH